MPSATVSEPAAQAQQRRVRLEYASSTNRGGRQQNEDSVGWHEAAGGLVAIVADGMGGGVDGKRFSEQAVAAVRGGAAGLTEPPGEAQLRAVIQSAAQEIRQLRLSSPRYQNSGTTLVAASVTLLSSEAVALVANIGDSRAYRISAAGEVQQLTRDHTYAERLISQGMAPEEANRQREAKHLTHALGDELSLESVPQFITALRLRPGDSLLLCTDGVSKHMEPHELATAAKGRSAQDTVNIITRESLRNGSKDNVTALLICCRSAGRALPALPYKVIAAATVALALGSGGTFAWMRANAGPATQVEGQQPAGLTAATITPLPDGSTPAPTLEGTATSLPTSTIGSSVTPTPTHTPTPTNTPLPPTPVPPQIPLSKPPGPVEATVTPELATATPELAMATPELATATPELAMATPEPTIAPSATVDVVILPLDLPTPEHILSPQPKPWQESKAP